MHSTAILSTILVALPLTVQAARAECLLLPVQYVVSREDVRFIFKGTPTSITPIGTAERASGQKVTLDVAWVWKGTPGQRVELYMDLNGNNPQFTAGRAAIVFVKYMDHDMQRRLGVMATDTSVLTVVPCSDGWSETEITAALGAGEAPREERKSPPTDVSTSPFKVYVVGGGGPALRPPGWSYSLATQSAPGTSTAWSIVGGAGVWLSSSVALEGSIGMTTAQSIDWFFGYLFAENGAKRTDDRDVPLTGMFRLAPLRHRAASLEGVVGGGMTFHRGTTFSTSDCGYGQFRTPCMMLTPPQFDEVWTSTEPILTFGADLALRASRRVAIAPGFRGNYARRPVYMTGYDHRGPYSGDGYFWTFGMTVRYSVR